MAIKLTIFALFLCFSAHFAYAGDEFAAYLSQTIYLDCNSSSNTFLSPVLFQLQPNISTYIGKSVTPELMKEVILIVIDNEPYAVQANVTGTINKSGAGLIVCGNKSLDADFNSYWWNGKLAGSSGHVFNQTQAQVPDQTTSQNNPPAPQPIQPDECGNANPAAQYGIFSDGSLYLLLALSAAVSLLAGVALGVYWMRKGKVGAKTQKKRTAVRKKRVPSHLRRKGRGTRAR